MECPNAYVIVFNVGSLKYLGLPLFIRLDYFDYRRQIGLSKFGLVIQLVWPCLIFLTRIKFVYCVLFYYVTLHHNAPQL